MARYKEKRGKAFSFPLSVPSLSLCPVFSLSVWAGATWAKKKLPKSYLNDVVRLSVTDSLIFYAHHILPGGSREDALCLLKCWTSNYRPFWVRRWVWVSDSFLPCLEHFVWRSPLWSDDRVQPLSLWKALTFGCLCIATPCSHRRFSGEKVKKIKRISWISFLALSICRLSAQHNQVSYWTKPCFEVLNFNRGVNSFLVREETLFSGSKPVWRISLKFL